MTEAAQKTANQFRAPSDAERMQTAMDRIKQLEEENLNLVDELEEAYWGDGDVRAEHVEALARARTAIYEGRPEEGRYQLERVLDEIDSCWRTLA